MNVGVLEHGEIARVDDRGAVRARGLHIDWMVGADDRWHIPAQDSGMHQHRIDPAPAFETAVRVPGGEVVQRTYGVATAAGPVVVVEVENRSPVPLTVALLVRVEHRARVEIDGSVLRIDGMPALALSRPPGAMAAGDATAEIVMRGDARPGPFGVLDGPIELALLFPVPHRTCVRAVVGDVGSYEPGAAPLRAADLPPADAVIRGWERQLERGLQVALPSPIGELVDAARVDLLVAPAREPAVVAALEDWGFDAEAATGWAGLRWRDRRRARSRVRPGDAWSAVRATDAERDPARFLSALRAALVWEQPPVVDLLPGFPPDWLGQSLTVDAIPLRAGALSFAVRWHGARPALLWDAPPGVELRAPALDPGWRSTAATGEALLSEPPAALLPMGTRERAAGEPVEAPGQFS